MKLPKKRLQQAIEQFRRRFAEQPTRLLGDLIGARELAAAVEQEVGAYRERLYPPLTTLGLFVEQVLSADGACQDAVARYLSERIARGQSGCSLNTGPYCKARQRLPLGLVRRVAEHTGCRLERAMPEPWRWRGRSVKLMDGTTVSMADSASNQAAYRQSGAQRPGLGFPLMRLVAVISLGSGAVLGWASGPCRGKSSGEQALFRPLIDELSAGDIILADRYHCSYFTVALLAERGIDLLSRQHPCRRTDERCGQRLGRGDRLVRWQRPQRPAWMDERTYARMPEQLQLRQTVVGGRMLVTTLVDSRTIRPSDLDALYRRRWQVELDLRSIKAEMGMDIIEARSPAMVDKTVAVHLLAYNLVRALMARAAAGAQVLARALSFKASLQLLRAFQQHLRLAAGRRASMMSAHLLGAVSRLRVPIRPHRCEPRAVKRRPKAHKLLTVPRPIARAALIQAQAARLR